MPGNDKIGLLNDILKTVDDKLRFPEAEALVPINPHHWGPYAAGAALASDLPNLEDRLKQGVFNLETAYDYLDTAPTDVCYNDRFADVFEDFLKVNAMCALGGDAGAFAAGAVATKRAEGYLDTAVKETAGRTMEQKFEIEAMKRQAKANGISAWSGTHETAYTAKV